MIWNSQRKKWLGERNCFMVEKIANADPSCVWNIEGNEANNNKEEIGEYLFY
jgi:hypothetical protein